MSEPITKQVEQICAALYDKKAQDIVAIHVADKTIIADWFVICSGHVPAQTKALCDELDEKASSFGLTLRRQEGYNEGRWIVLDYGTVLVHIFLPDERRFYDMERLWDEDERAIRYSTERDEA